MECAICLINEKTIEKALKELGIEELKDKLIVVVPPTGL